jgi:hypothetical protein
MRVNDAIKRKRKQRNEEDEMMSMKQQDERIQEITGLKNKKKSKLRRVVIGSALVAGSTAVAIKVWPKLSNKVVEKWQNRSGFRNGEEDR